VIPSAPKAVLTRMRADRFAAAVGVKLVDVEPGRALARLRLRPEHLNGVGVVQGGAIFTLADLAFAAASNARGPVAVALDAGITFARAARSGTLTAEAREESVSRRVSVCTVRVTDDAGTLVALFRGTAFRKEEPAPERGAGAPSAAAAARTAAVPARRGRRRAAAAPRVRRGARPPATRPRRG
jgi:acyl-CoA thioesterase